jgi:hypothetical protein
VIEDLLYRMLGSTRHSLRKADRAFHELKAVHHAAQTEDLAEEASEVLNGTKWWSRQDFMEFLKELNWELQAYDEANNKLELSELSMSASGEIRCPSAWCKASRGESLVGLRLQMEGVPETQPGSSSTPPHI